MGGVEIGSGVNTTNSKRSGARPMTPSQVLAASLAGSVGPPLTPIPPPHGEARLPPLTRHHTVVEPRTTQGLSDRRHHRYIVHLCYL